MVDKEDGGEILRELKKFNVNPLAPEFPFKF